jgi:hypothetical protein
MYMNTNVDSALSWPVLSQDCLQAPEDAAWLIQPQRPSKMEGRFFAGTEV